MAQIDDGRDLPACVIYETPMTLVLNEPKVASFTELQTFRCFACGDRLTGEQEKTQPVRSAVWPRSGFFAEAASVGNLFHFKLSNQCRQLEQQRAKVGPEIE
jgi:hypothetical protein